MLKFLFYFISLRLMFKILILNPKIQMKQTFNFLLMLVMVATVLSCKKSEPEPLPTADFTFTPTTSRFPITVTFTNTSLNATTYAWDFGGGAPASTEKSPVVNFTAGGTFIVTLTATGAGGVTKATKNIVLLPPSIVGKYTLTASTRTRDGVVENNLTGRDACRADDISEFTTDGKLIESEGATACTPPRTFGLPAPYSISADGKTLTITLTDNSGVVRTELYTIEEFINSALKLSITRTGTNAGVTTTATFNFTLTKI